MGLRLIKSDWPARTRPLPLQRMLKGENENVGGNKSKSGTQQAGFDAISAVEL